MSPCQPEGSAMSDLRLEELERYRLRDLSPRQRNGVDEYVKSLTPEVDDEAGGEEPRSVLEWLKGHPHNAPDGDDESGLFVTYVWFRPKDGAFVATVTISKDDRDARQRHELTGKGLIGFYHIVRPFRGTPWLAKEVF